MKTLILSSSLNPKSRSFKLCQYIHQKIEAEGASVTLVDARNIELAPVFRGPTDDMKKLIEQVKEADNIIFGMAVYCYSVNDSLKMMLDNCFEHASNKFFGILCAGGGERSYLATQHLSQICMKEWRMIQLPRVVYASGLDFDDDDNPKEHLIERLDQFSEDYYQIGSKLIA